MAERLEIEITRLSGIDDLPLPKRMSEGASGADLYAALDKTVTIEPGAFALIPTGIAIAVPRGHEAQVRSRSGLAARNGVFVLNSPGTIDADYRGEIGVILANLGAEPFAVERGDRIAQIVVSRISEVEWVEKKELGRTGRQHGGFGHTGVSQDRE